jgi:hypothetical protein
LFKNKDLSGCISNHIFSRNKPFMKKIILFVAMTTQLLYAFAFRIEYGKNIIISQPIYDDLYITGGYITINAPIHGDLIIAGGTIVINDTVTNDILLGGGDVTFNGYVGDDIRGVGSTLRISKNVAGEVAIAAGELTVDAGVVIGGLMISAGTVTLNGDVRGEVKAAFGKLYLNGNVGEGIYCRGGTLNINGSIGGKSVLSAKTILPGDKALFNNDVRYWSEQKVEKLDSHTRNGKVIYDPGLRIRTEQWYFLGAASVFLLLWYLGMALLMILIIQYLFAGTMKNSANTVFNHSLKSLGFGFLFFIGLPVAAVVLFFTVVGVPVALLLIVGYIILILLATTITSVVSANWFNNRFEKNWHYWRLAFVAFGIFVLLKLISLAPFVGGIILFLLACTSFGAILLTIPWKKTGKVAVNQQAASSL